MSSSRAQGLLPPRVLEALNRRGTLKSNDRYDDLDDELLGRATAFLGGKAINAELLLTYIGAAESLGEGASRGAYLRSALDLAERA